MGSVPALEGEQDARTERCAVTCPGDPGVSRTGSSHFLSSGAHRPVLPTARECSGASVFGDVEQGLFGVSEQGGAFLQEWGQGYQLFLAIDGIDAVLAEEATGGLFFQIITFRAELSPFRINPDK